MSDDVKAVTKLEVEDRAYEADLTAEERALLLARVYVVAERLVVLRELPVVTAFTVKLLLSAWRCSAAAGTAMR
ncbi:MAG: hypothetical protein EXR75_09880 [Myxococcales bacterium]|nr:hypothetical protein [Myxococcales bacterium]